jgi:aspartate dehydrogenase
MLEVTLIGFGAIGQSICKRLAGSKLMRVSHVVVRASRLAEAKTLVKSIVTDDIQGIEVVTEVPANAQLVLECAGHEALKTHVVSALQRGVECAVLSVGALAEPGLPELLSDAAKQGATQVHLLSGAIGGIEALAAAKLAGLDEVTYTGRKPPSAWGVVTVQNSSTTPVLEEIIATNPIQQAQAAIICEATAREAARLYPKNANVAATVALAGLGLDHTKVRLISDPSVTDNIHEILARGAFGEMKIEMRGKPLADNPKTSALTVLSALRFLHNRVGSITI